MRITPPLDSHRFSTIVVWRQSKSLDSVVSSTEAQLVVTVKDSKAKANDASPISRQAGRLPHYPLLPSPLKTPLLLRFQLQMIFTLIFST